MIQAPLGAELDFLPEDHNIYHVNDVPYYYYGGTYYNYDEEKEIYTVTAAPEGVIIEVLPHGYKIFEKDDITYFVVDDTYYRATTREGKVVYKVVEKPVE